MVELITDRSQYHVTLLNRLRKKSWSSMRASEQSAWNNDATKGAYNYTDLNRVERAVNELAGKLGLSLTTKINWTLWDVPTQSEMERYLGNIKAIRDACPGEVEFPTLPSSMNGLTFTSANNIEKVLLLVYEEVNKVSDHDCVLGEFVLGECVLSSEQHGTDNPENEDYICSGEIYSGEVL